MPPSASDHLRAVLLAALCVAALAQPAAASPAVSFAGHPGLGCGPKNVEGWEFQTTAPISVSALGVFDSFEDGLQFAVPVGLYDSTCALVASVIIPAGSGAPLHDRYRYAAIAPLNLPVGQTFRIAAVMHCDDYSASAQGLADVVLDPALTGVLTRRIGGAAALACPTQTLGGTSVDVTPNFQIGPPCGNGVVEAGELCDDANTVDDDCCSLACTPAQAGMPCAEDDLTCTADVCDAAGTCTHAPGNAGVECGPAEDDCHVPNRCDGETEECPELDQGKDLGAPCTDDGWFCTGEETCGETGCMSPGDPCDGAVCDEALDRCIAFTPTVTPPAAATLTRTPSLTPQAPTGTASATHAASASATATASPIAPATSSATPADATPATTPTEPSGECVGDCEGDGDVTINELITGVTIALGSQGLAECPRFDPSGSGAVEINELIAAVNAALAGCS